ncbi:MauE/DoxX family redox-associated membrane protein [uncultured Pseudodesulfovibrio sp.]|uniref:MauE/DoxX family redox-associated membrane protein n=1 Tax=uncultured Pseudodesulfovibrio sp. TaxID=2035858 RepID=UPI0029C968DF|nr:MauE/DoxX family redox-associated membrane protein [uncultured Pseudodesulfovibrio sp.]
MLKILYSKWLYCVLRLVIGGLFVYAGILKLADPTAFAVSIDGYGMVTWRMAKVLAHVLPVIEVAAGIGLLLDIKGAMALIVAQLLMFIGVLSYAIHMGLDVDCGCFGPEASSGGESGGLWPTLIRDIVMLVACVLMYWQRRAAGFAPRSITRIFRPGS